MSTKEERVHTVFENIYDNYDKMNSVISFQQHLKWRRDTMKKMNVKEGAKALDVSLRNRRLDHCSGKCSRI